MFAQFGAMPGTGITVAVLVLVAVLFFVIAWFQGRGARSAAQWSTTQGEVMEATVVQYLHHTNEGGSMTAYRPNIIYGYRVNGRDYVSQRLNFNTTMHSSIKSFADSKIRQFPTGSKVQVFYDPQNPNEATLERSNPGSRLMILIAGLMLMLALVICVLGFPLGAIFGGLGK